MNISPMTYYTNTNYSTKPMHNINFKSNKGFKAASTLVSSQEITQCIAKLTNKTKFISKILGDNAKTSKPVLTKIGDTNAFINMDKTQMGLTKIKIYSATNDVYYNYSQDLQQVIPTLGSTQHEQSLEVIINNKDGRMIYGILDCDAGHLHFERNTKTGRRDGTGQGIYTFRLSPNINEHQSDWEYQRIEADKNGNTISAVFSAVFMDLMLVKPNIKLI